MKRILELLLVVCMAQPLLAGGDECYMIEMCPEKCNSCPEWTDEIWADCYRQMVLKQVYFRFDDPLCGGGQINIEFRVYRIDCDNSSSYCPQVCGPAAYTHLNDILPWDGKTEDNGLYAATQNQSCGYWPDGTGYLGLRNCSLYGYSKYDLTVCLGLWNTPSQCWLRALSWEEVQAEVLATAPTYCYCIPPTYSEMLYPCTAQCTQYRYEKVSECGS